MQVPYSGVVLHLGSRGSPVYAVKRAMHTAGFFDRIGYHRFYGPRFASAVEAFQTANNLTPDGRIGRQTLNALEPFFDNYGYLLYTGRYPNVPVLQLPETFSPTHQTGGLEGFPAVDCFAVADTDVLAPENVTLEWPHFIPWDQNRHVGGWTAYLQGDGCTYFVTHFNDLAKRGFYAHGQKIGTVAAVPHQWWPSHVHEGKHQGHYTPAQRRRCPSSSPPQRNRRPHEQRYGSQEGASPSSPSSSVCTAPAWSPVSICSSATTIARCAFTQVSVAD